MFNRLKLIHQVIILVALPLVFELSFMGILSVMMSDLEADLNKEARAKEAVSLLTELIQGTVGLQIAMFESTMLRDESAQQKYAARAREIQDRSAYLEKLVAGDATASKIIREARRHIKKLVDLVPELTSALDPEGDFIYAQFVRDRDFWLEMLYSTRQNQRCIQQLIDYYRKTIDEIRPREVNARKNIRNYILAAAFLNMALAFGLANYFSTVVLRRIEILMKNVNRFATGEELIKPPPGNDEIAELDREFRTMAEARRRAERIRSDMVAMVSHDLRTPLSGISGYVTLLAEGTYGTLESKQLSIVSRMDSEISRLLQLANDLLDIEKIESGALELDLQESSLDEIVAASLNAVKGISEIKGVPLTSEFQARTSITCDPDRVVQVLVNLLSNAIKFTKKNTGVTLKAFSSLGGQRFEVIDHGRGIPSSSQAFVFDRFYQLEQDSATMSTGSGLGLTICKAIVEAHGGIIGVI
ncbi:MAG: HAMP domain-containing histidine kinase, partial [Cyanobacteria bacterium]|nr:HAMP domain-containing histidine kinase [Cyanobacteriota bacterium]